MTEYNKLYDVPIQLEGYDPTYKVTKDKLKRLQPLLRMRNVLLLLQVQVY